MTGTDVQKLYTRFGGRWWQPFRAAWEFVAAKPAVRHLEALMRQYGTAGVSVLDVGCGAGENLARLRRLGVQFDSYTGVDFSPHMLALVRKRFDGIERVRFVEADATALPDTGDRYDLIISTWLLDHLEEPAEVVNSVQRLLAPGGHMIVMFYSRPGWFLRSWFVPIGRLLVLADPVPESEVARFNGVSAKRSYSGGLSTIVDITVPGE